MFELLFTKVVVPLAVDAVTKYIGSSSTDKDDKVLKVVKEGAKYLVDKPNNTLEKETTIQDVEKCLMRFTQGEQG